MIKIRHFYINFHVFFLSKVITFRLMPELGLSKDLNSYIFINAPVKQIIKEKRNTNLKKGTFDAFSLQICCYLFQGSSTCIKTFFVIKKKPLLALRSLIFPADALNQCSQCFHWVNKRTKKSIRNVSDVGFWIKPLKKRQIFPIIWSFWTEGQNHGPLQHMLIQ